MTPKAYAATYMQLLSLALAVRATPVDALADHIKEWQASDPGFDDPQVKALVTTGVAKAEAVVRAALEFKRAIDRVFPIVTEVATT